MKYDDYTPQVTGVWLNEMVTGSHQPMHTHYGATFSGSFYIDSPVGANDIWFTRAEVGSCFPFIQFAKEMHKGNAFNQSFSTERGNIVMFPSHLKHEVPPGKFDGIRRSIAFDIVLQSPPARFRLGKSLV